MRTSSPTGVTPARTTTASAARTTSRTGTATGTGTGTARATARATSGRAHAVLAVAALVLAALLPGASATAHAAGPPPKRAVPCATGQLCLWAQPDFKGKRHVHELSSLDVNSCTALPAGTSVQSLVNRTGRPVTTYQSAECAETGEFQTYPGDGVQLPESPYLVRAFKVWER
ncbi:peptidase inhibitor family I36 protein [Streptomyces sp. NPDC004244]|uniref:peptidase inhibitor family I36 protein n=1 Tax=Streptomyces sp. NPDC101206 TaxID=3366128 RepID=UPI00382C7425